MQGRRGGPGGRPGLAKQGKGPMDPASLDTEGEFRLASVGNLETRVSVH